LLLKRSQTGSQERCQGIFKLINQEQYFVIHAARQSGKTTLLLELAQQLNQAGEYVNRSAGISFVHSIVLVGMRNTCLFKGKIREERETLGSASPFNIVSDALTLPNFTFEEVANLATGYAY